MLVEGVPGISICRSKGAYSGVKAGRLARGDGEDEDGTSFAIAMGSATSQAHSLPRLACTSVAMSHRPIYSEKTKLWSQWLKLSANVSGVCIRVIIGYLRV